MKIAILLGRGIEGCGVTRFATELQSYLLSQDYQCKSFAATDKKWGRKNSQNTSIIEFDNNDIDKIKNELNTFDIVFYQSLPSKSNSELYKNKFFEELVLNVNNPIKIIFQNDHKIHSLNRNSMLWETVAEMDCAFTFGKGTVFNKKIKQLNIDTPVKFFNNGHDFSKLTHLIKKEQQRKISYLGRYATFKEPNRMIHLQPLLSKHNIVCEARGIEKSIGAKTKFFCSNEKDLKSPEHSNIKYRSKSIIDEQDLDHLHVYGPYDRMPTLELLSNNMFGANFFNLKKEEYNNIIEYSTLEMINVGMIVVVDKQWAQNNYHIQGDSFYDLNCFIYNERNDYQSTVDQVVELANNQELRSKKRRLAYNVAKSHCDVNIAFKDLIDKAKQVNKKQITNHELF